MWDLHGNCHSESLGVNQKEVGRLDAGHVSPSLPTAALQVSLEGHRVSQDVRSPPKREASCVVLCNPPFSSQNPSSRECLNFPLPY